MMRELRVEDALLYLDQVKMEFGDRPHIYNEFLDIMKTFKTQQIDTPGVIRRVSNLFQGNKKLVLGFNTFLPEGYKIELPMDGEGPPVALFRPPGTKKYHVLGGPGSSPVPQPSSQQLGVASIGGPAPGQPGTMISQQGTGPGLARAELPAHAQQPLHPGQPPLRQATSGGPSLAHAQHPNQSHVRAQQLGASVGKQSGGMVVDQSGVGAAFQQQGDPGHQQQPGAPRLQKMPLNNARFTSYLPDSEMPFVIRKAGTPQTGVAPEHASGPSGQLRMGQGPQQAVGVNPRSMPPGPHNQPAQPDAQAQPPVEFDHAINYVTTIKKRFAAEPETYKKFLEILHTYQKEQRGIKEVLDEVSVLFADHPDLLKEFTYFLPDAVQAQAKAQLDQVAKESEARKRAATSKQAIMQTAQGMQKQAQVLARPGVKPVSSTSPSNIMIPFGATQGRTDEREREIEKSAVYGNVTFAPVRPPKKSDLTPSQAAQKNGRPTVIPPVPRQPTTSEAAFFERVKNHLNRKELAPDKPPGSRRHTPYTEFLKCLHLFGAAVLSKDELLLLLRGLFVQGHAPKSGVNAGGASNPLVVGDAHNLLREFEEVFIGRGPYADQENAFKDKSKYGSIMTRDLDFSHSERPTPSYCTYPSDYPSSLFLSNSGQIESLDPAVLNTSLVCVGPERSSRSSLSHSPESYDGVRARRNAYEEAMFKIEDERYEVDMAIERNALTMREIEPMAEEATRLRETEEKDGQPIGRLQYQLRSRTLNTTHINSMARVYGDHGDEVLQHLVRNPLVVLPIVYQRLRQKDAEWRAAKNDMMERWNAVVNANYEGSLDVLCHFYRREIERCFTVDQLRQECQRARVYVKHPNRLSNHPAVKPFLPEFALSSPDLDAVLFQPFITIRIRNDVPLPHKDAFQLLSDQVRKHAARSKVDRERVGRIWAEFAVPWFKVPMNTVQAEVRGSYVGTHATSVVKYVMGQRVRTAFGDGTIMSVVDGNSSVAFRYRVKLAFGIGYIRPSAIFHKLPEKKGSAIYVRKGGYMEKVAVTTEGECAVPRVGEGFQLLFATQSTYLFMRLYCILIKMLVDIRESLNATPSVVDPCKSYYNPKKDEKRTEVESLRYDYHGVLGALRKFILRENGMNTKEFERFCRIVSKEKVHQMAVLPKLVEKCAEALVSLAREDVLLHLYDYCCTKEADPVKLRAQCLSVSRNASYRIQYDFEQGCHHFCYLPEGEELLTTSPRGDPREGSHKVNKSADTGDNGYDMADKDEVMDEAAAQAMDTGDDDDGPFDGPQTKRAKLK